MTAEINQDYINQEEINCNYEKSPNGNLIETYENRNKFLIKNHTLTKKCLYIAKSE